MKFKKKIPIDLKEFICSGKFDCLELGQTQEWVLFNFPDPDYMLNDLSSDNNIFGYGNIELHFLNQQLSIIICDKLQIESKLNGGKLLDLNAWVFENTETLTLSFVIQELNKLSLDFTKFKRKYYNNNTEYDIYLFLESGVELIFSSSDLEDDNDRLLDCFQFSNLSANRFRMIDDL